MHSYTVLSQKIYCRGAAVRCDRYAGAVAGNTSPRSLSTAAAHRRRSASTTSPMHRMRCTRRLYPRCYLLATGRGRETLVATCRPLQPEA